MQMSDNKDMFDNEQYVWQQEIIWQQTRCLTTTASVEGWLVLNDRMMVYFNCK